MADVFVLKFLLWIPGFMVETYYNFSTGGDVNLNWYHYQYTSNQTLPDGINVYDSPFYGNVHLQLKPRWNAVNLEFGNSFNLNNRNKIRLHGGIQYADMQLNNITTSSVLVKGAGLERINKSSYYGTGIRGGVDYSYDVGYGFATNFKAAATLLLGHHDFTRQYYIYTSLTPGFNGNHGSSNAIVSALEGKMGASYNYATMYNLFSIYAGWMVVNYYNPIETADYVHHGRSKESNFAVSGAYVGIRWTNNKVIMPMKWGQYL